MKSILLALVLTIASVGGPQSFAAFPPKITVKFKEKMSCRDVKKLLKPNHLYVSCTTNSMRSVSYSADYLGRTPLQQVISTLTSNAKVQTISPEEEPETVPGASALAPTAASAVY